VEITWRSFELRPVDGPPPSPEYLAKVKAGRPQFYAMAKERYGLDLNPGPFGINSRPALIGAKYAEEQGQGEAYQAAIFQAYWMEGRNIAEVAVLQEIAGEIGLDGEAFLAALETEDYRAAMLAEVEQAHAYGITAVPSLILDNKYLVVGAQPYEVLTDVVDQIEAGTVTTR